MFDKNELMSHLKEESDTDSNLLPRPVKVRMFKLGWMTKDGKNFIVLTPVLGEKDQDEFYKSEFMGNMM